MASCRPYLAPRAIANGGETGRNNARSGSNRSLPVLCLARVAAGRAAKAGGYGIRRNASENLRARGEMAARPVCAKAYAGERA